MGCPCQDCPHRKLSCHAHCEEYLEWHDALVEAKRKVYAAYKAIDFLSEMARKRERKVRRRK